MRWLKSLSLRVVNNLTEKGLILALKNLLYLEGLDISGCMKVDLAPLLYALAYNK